MSTDVTEVVKKEGKEVHQAIKHSSLSYYMLKPPTLCAQVFKENKKAQEKLFKNI